MHMPKGIRFLSFFLLSILVCPLVFSSSAETDQSRNIVVTINYHTADTPLPGATFALYKVADITPQGEYAITNPFIAADITQEHIINVEMWRDLAPVLSSYVSKTETDPNFTVTTAENGIAVFSVSPGLYLVCGNPLELDWKQYNAECNLLALPTHSSDQYLNDKVTIFPKPEITPIPKRQLQVLKIWNDAHNTSSRPDMIEVELLQNNRRYDTVTLSKSNSWTYHWKELDARHQWSVKEKNIPHTYSVTYEQIGDRFIITNSLNTSPSSPENTLPQTGLIWWPVPLLALGGMLLFLVGWLMRRQEN